MSILLEGILCQGNSTTPCESLKRLPTLIARPTTRSTCLPAFFREIRRHFTWQHRSAMTP